MYRRLIGVAVLAVSFSGGCGGPSAPLTAPVARHNGNIVDLPDAQGYVELKAERNLPGKGAARVANKSRLTAYFYQPDATTALSPAPSDVKVTLGLAGAGTEIKLAPKPDDPGAFVSEIGDYPDGLRGQIDFQLAGKPVTAPFIFR